MTDSVLSAEGLRSAPRGRRQRGSLLIGASLFIVGGLVVLAVFGPLIRPDPPNAQDVTNILASPSSEHWLGTDELGRDVLSRLITGARTALAGPLIVAFGSMVLGTTLGLLAGYRGGTVDAVIMRGVDLAWAVPQLLIVIVIVGAVGGGYWLAVGLLTFFFTPGTIRIARGATLEQAPRPYVEAARVLGVPDIKIMFLHIWPNIAAISLANTFLAFATALVSLSALSFLGLGAPVGTPDWGVMLAEARRVLFENPIGVLAPAAAIVITATSMNLVGDWVYERISARGAVR